MSLPLQIIRKSNEEHPFIDVGRHHDEDADDHRRTHGKPGQEQDINHAGQGEGHGPRIRAGSRRLLNSTAWTTKAKNRAKARMSSAAFCMSAIIWAWPP